VKLHMNECQAREEDAASVHAYSGTRCANSQRTSDQARDEHAASVYGHTQTL